MARFGSVAGPFGVTELDANRIAAAALAVVDEHGLGGFTMRAVADALGVTPMALYHHVADKAALATLVVDLVLSERPLPSPTGGAWQDDLWEMACWARETVMAHPVVAHLRQLYQVWTPSMLAMAERWFGIWQQSGLAFDKAILAASSSSMAIFGAVNQEMILRDLKPPGDEMLSMLPNTRSLLAAERNPTADFELLVRSVVEGLHARLSRS